MEQFELSDGQRLLYAQVHNLVQAMTAFALPPMGQNSLRLEQQGVLAPVIAASWD